MFSNALNYFVFINFNRITINLGGKIFKIFHRIKLSFKKIFFLGLEPNEKSTTIAVKTLKPDSCKSHLQVNN